MVTKGKKFTRAISIDVRSRQFVKGRNKYYSSFSKDSLVEVYRGLYNASTHTDNVN